MTNPIIATLKATRWYRPTVERYREHVAACESLGCDPDPLERFAAEILNTPKHLRDWLLKVEPIPEHAPFMRFAQYDAPIKTEIGLGTWGGMQAK